MNPHTQTDAESIAELREAADEARAARLEVVSEIARLTTALRVAEAERDAAHKERGEMTFARNVARTLANNLAAECDAARQDAERLAELVSEAMCITEALRVIGHNCQTSNGNLYQFGNKCRAALAAHAAATGKQG